MNPNSQSLNNNPEYLKQVNHSTKDRYYANYAPRVAAFAAEVGSEINATGIPEPHLPCFGAAYGVATAPKVAIVGRDTKYWGDMPDFLRAASADPRTALNRHEKGFHEFQFTTWNYHFGRTFWATLLKLLAPAATSKTLLKNQSSSAR